MKTNLLAAVLAGMLLDWAALAQTTFLDSTFDPGSGANDLVESLLVQPDGKILICGIFTQFNGQPRSYIARLNTDGSIDTTFNGAPSYWVRYMALQPDGKVVIGGFFTNVGGTARNRIARLNSDGSLDTSFDPGTGCEGKVVPADDKDPFVFAIVVQADGKSVVAGNFATFNGVPSSGIVRLNTDGSLDTSFQVGAGFNSWGRFLLQLPNNQILATGWFTSYNNQSFNRMVILNSDGSADHSFNPYFGDDTAIYGSVLLPNGQYIAGGHSINGQGLFRQEFARLNADGTYDTNYNASASDKVESIYLQPDGRIIIGGYFSQVDGASRNGLARINADGTLDTNFMAETDNFVWTIRGQDDGKILVCGGFSTVAGVSRHGVARVLTDAPTVVGTGSTGGGTTGGGTTGGGTTGGGTTGGGTTGGGTTGGGTTGGGGDTGGPTGGDTGSGLQLLQPAMANGQFSVSAPTQTGKTYFLQYRTPDSGHWLGLPPFTGDGTVHQFIDPYAANDSSRLYRIVAF